MFEALEPPFRGLRAGDSVRYRQYAGLGPNGPEYRETSGPVIRFLVFPDHVVVKTRNGCQVVNSENFVRINRRSRR